jgi:ATP-dependent Clp protease adapter protein ClpS
MRDGPSDAGNLEIVFHDDDRTPHRFVVDLLMSTFGFVEAQATQFASRVSAEGRAACSYPKAVAEALFQVAGRRIAESGHPLQMSLEGGEGAAGREGGRCAVCGKPAGGSDPGYSGPAGTVCSACILAAAERLSAEAESRPFRYVHEALASFLAGIPQDQLVATSRLFPGHMRADLQIAIEQLMARSAVRFMGIYERHRYETVTFAALTEGGREAPTIAAAQYHDVDVGEDRPTRCLENGLWLCRSSGGLRYTVLLCFHREYGTASGLRVEIVTPAGEAGRDLTAAAFAELEAAVDAARVYRGKVLSFEMDSDYRGRTKGMMVHRLPPVAREEVILPAGTLELLDRNVLRFVQSRDALRRLGQSTRKGILLYGPPGTGKTHTIRYLASSLPGHTTLIVTAEQVGILGEYMTLARVLQPALVVIEDVDLIARDRQQMGSPCEEVLLNKLLNEMDGLRQEADILFVLTTNRPEQLETALAGRPGRIDQAIEVPLPDAAGRDKLVRLYGKGLALEPDVVGEAVRRTEGVSAAFIKEMMRRTAQASIARDGCGAVTGADLREALDDMLFTGGKLNIKLLGGASAYLLTGAPPHHGVLRRA